MKQLSLPQEQMAHVYNLLTKLGSYQEGMTDRSGVSLETWKHIDLDVIVIRTEETVNTIYNQTRNIMLVTEQETTQP